RYLPGDAAPRVEAEPVVPGAKGAAVRPVAQDAHRRGGRPDEREPEPDGPATADQRGPTRPERAGAGTTGVTATAGGRALPFDRRRRTDKRRGHRALAGRRQQGTG